MTNQVSILEKKITVLEEQIQSIRVERYKVQEKFHIALTSCFQKYFRGVVSEDIKLYCSASLIQFKKMNEEGTYEKEIFSIYLKERFGEEEGRYTGVELSYYTTNCNSDFELTRIEALGKVASVVKNYKEEIREKANVLAKIHFAEMQAEEFYKREYDLEKQVRELKNEIYTIKKEEKRNALFSEEGLTFEKPINVQLKANYTVRVRNIKLIEIAKSGKTATAVFTFSHGDYISREERVSIEKVVAQVI
jgi:hypothetical protein